MPRFSIAIGTGLLVLGLSGAVLKAGNHELKTLESAGTVIRELSAIPLKGIPFALVHNAAGVAIIPHVIKAGLVFDVESGRGVMLVHEPDGFWSNPLFIILKGGGVGGQAGIEATDLVLVFKTKKSLDRALRGNLTLGADVSVAAGPLGREAEAAGDGRPLAEIFTYSRSRGLFAGVSLAGSRLRVDGRANEGFYGVHGGLPADVLAHRGQPIVAAEALKAELARLSGTTVVPAPAPVIIPGPPVLQPGLPVAPQPVPVPFPPR